MRAARASAAGGPTRFARSTGIRSMIVFMRSTPPRLRSAPSLVACSDAGAAGVDRPQRLHAPVADTDVPIMQIDRRIAVSGDEPELLAERQRPRARPLSLGEKLWLIPGHCDPTVNLHDWYVGVRNGRVETLWPINARGASI